MCDLKKEVYVPRTQGPPQPPQFRVSYIPRFSATVFLVTRSSNNPYARTSLSQLIFLSPSLCATDVSIRLFDNLWLSLSINTLARLLSAPLDSEKTRAFSAGAVAFVKKGVHHRVTKGHATLSFFSALTPPPRRTRLRCLPLYVRERNPIWFIESGL